jgi:hypothetical protein
MSDKATITYVVTIATGTDSGAGTNSSIYVTLLGTEGTSRSYELDKDHHNDFENGAVDDYELESSEDYGKITAVRVAVLGGTANTPWQLSYVKVKNKTTNEYYGRADCNCWLETGDSKNLTLSP